ncbi:MAG TPA: ROK family protein [Terriglobales bacterium]|jgi:polyphosphate glucokinase|nr:ROK family protein [Terriglobales bacterium]
MGDAASSKKKKKKQTAAPSEVPTPGAQGPRTLAIDIGGTGIKAMLLDESGKPLTDRLRAKTPSPATPQAVIAVISDFAKQLGGFDRASVGFPGVIKKGVVYTAANLDKKWIEFPFAEELSKALGKPVRMANDAVVQGLGGVSGVGVELVITLGTGMGAALYLDGVPIPSLEMSHHPFRKCKTYEDYLGKRALAKEGRKRWNKRLREAIDQLYRVFYYDRLYIGGGNAAKISIKLPRNAKTISNQDGILGGIKLWERNLDETQ